MPAITNQNTVDDPFAGTGALQPAAVLGDLASIDQMVAENPEILSVATLRWQLRHRTENGLDACCVQLGKKILISRTRYAAWVAGQFGK